MDNPSCFKTGENHPNYGQPRIEGAGRPSQQIEVIDKYFSRNQTKPYKGQYTFKKL